MNHRKAADHSDIRINNRRLIIDTLRSHERLSRSDLAKRLKMSKPAITANVEYLISEGIITELGFGEASKKGGRPPVLLEFNKNHRYMICIDLNYRHPFIALGNIGCELIDKVKIIVSEELGPPERLKTASDAIRNIFDKNNVDITKLSTIIISSPGVIDKDTGEILSNPQFQGWTKIGLNNYLQHEFQKCVLIKNDTSLGVLAEANFGRGIGQENLLYVSCGLGLGAGLLINSVLYEGKRQAVGEIGCFRHDAYGEGLGLEKLIAIEFLIENIKKDIQAGAKTVLREVSEELRFEDLVQAYNQGDQYLKELIYNNGRLLGTGIANLASALDMSLVTVGGEYLAFEQEFLRGIREVTHRIPFMPVEVMPTSLGAEIGIYGGFVYALENVFEEIIK